MAITVNGAAFISLAIRRGATLGDLVTIGRQGLYAPKAMLNEILVQAGRPPGYMLPEGDPGFPQKGEWADDLYRHFGARELSILDGSAYEGAGLIHDLNRKLPTELENRFDCLIDGGSLEHVFNVPEALASYMKMVRIGGHVILLDMPATNLCGHGFYQFSPALFWQVFSKVYGFEVVEMIVSETHPFATFRRVRNPAEIGRRVELVHDRPCHLHVIARKVASFPGFSTAFPIQEDYSQSWGGTSQPAQMPADDARIGARIRQLAARIAPRLYWRITNQRDANRRLSRMALDGKDALNPYERLPDKSTPDRD